MEALVTILIPLLIQVESGGNPKAIGDGGKAVGVLQLHPIYVADVNRIYGTAYKAKDRLSEAQSKTITRLYLTHYGARYERLAGKKATLEVLARIHNGGPDGWKKQATKAYWNKIAKLKQ